MTVLSQASCRRLRQLPQTQSVWEGDRRLLSQGLATHLEDDPQSEAQGDCILWVDGGEGLVRAVEVVPSDTGHEAVVRALLRAMEYPHGGAEPGRPSKIVVRDREIQFFLRGALQNLSITIEYAPTLPLIDEIFRGLQEQMMVRHQPQLPDLYAEALIEQAVNIWELSPWEFLDEQQIITVELNRWDIGTLYLSVLGMMGVEFGILMYRSLDSLKQFRQRVLRANQSAQQMQQAFLEQDCLFLTFDALEEEELSGLTELDDYLEADWLDPDAEREPSFGSLHPLEGLRTHLATEEAGTILITLKALQRFIQQHRRSLNQDDWPALKNRYRIPNPEPNGSPKTITVTVETLPELAQELMEMTSASLLEEAGAIQPAPLQEDFLPENALIDFRLLPWSWVDEFSQTRSSLYFPTQPALNPVGTGLPVILIQTSQPKAESLVHEIRAAGGLQLVCFNLGEDPFSGEEYDLGLLQTQDGELHLFAEYLRQDPEYRRDRRDWDNQVRETQGNCGVAIARGVTGKNRGKPQARDLVALFEVPLKTADELGLSPLKLQVALDWT